MDAIRSTLIQRDRAYQEAKAIYEQKGALAVEGMLDDIEQKRRIEIENSSASYSSRSGPMLPMPKLDD